jgi:hypothetical protein
VDAFLNGLFGGKTAEASVDEPAVAQVATGEKTLVTVGIARPMGMVMEPLWCGELCKGAVVTELVEGGSADNSGMIEVGDVLVGRVGTRSSTRSSNPFQQPSQQYSQVTVTNLTPKSANPTYSEHLTLNPKPYSPGAAPTRTTSATRGTRIYWTPSG